MGGWTENSGESIDLSVPGARHVVYFAPSDVADAIEGGFPLADGLAAVAKIENGVGYVYDVASASWEDAGSAAFLFGAAYANSSVEMFMAAQLWSLPAKAHPDAWSVNVPHSSHQSDAAGIDPLATSMTATSTLEKLPTIREHAVLLLPMASESSMCISEGSDDGQFEDSGNDGSSSTLSRDQAATDIVDKTVSSSSSAISDLPASPRTISNCLDWFLIDYAAMATCLVSVPIHYTLAPPVARHILASTHPTLLCLGYSSIRPWIPVLVDSDRSTRQALTHILVFDVDAVGAAELEAACAELRNATGCVVASMVDMQSLATTRVRHDALAPCRPGACRQLDRPDADAPVLTIIATSGSTGMPKGVVVPVAAWTEAVVKPKAVPDPLVTISYAPLAHMFDRRSSLNTLVRGGRVALYTGEPAQVFDIFAAVRPTMFASTPRLWIMLYKQFQDAIAAPDADPAAIKSQFNARLGGSLRYITTGGASTPPAVLAWLIDTFSASVNDGYGATEVGSIATNGRIVPGVSIRLRDVPDMGYLATDKPHPRGELLVRTPSMAKAYVGAVDPAAAVDAFNAANDGFYATGDVVELLGPRSIRIIDRCKNFVKLAQGEFVSPEYVEGVLLGAATSISAIFVHGSPAASYLIAVVVPAASAAHLLQSDLAAELVRAGTAGGLLPHEIPLAVVLAPTPFADVPGLLTPSGKLARSTLRAHFDHAMATAAAAFEAEQGSVIHGTLAVLRSLVAGDGAATSHDASFAARGGDSLEAMRLVSLINASFDVSVTVADVVGAHSLTALADVIRASAAGDEAAAASARAVSDSAVTNDLARGRALEPGAAEIWARALDDADGAAGGSRPANLPPIRLLVTGGTGLLGAVLVALVLADAGDDVAVTCIVRGDEPEARLLLVLRTTGLVADDAMDAAMASDRLRVVRGDLAEPFLGVGAATLALWARTGAFTAIVHAGAAVNSVLPYASLARVNVGAVRYVAALAEASASCCQLIHVSTIGVVSLLAKRGTLPPFTPLATLPAALAELEPRAFVGYNGTKAVAEILLTRPPLSADVTLVRCGYLCGARGSGFTNPRDYLSRLVRHCVAARSFPSSAPSARFEMTPVDDAARAVLAMVTGMNGSAGGVGDAAVVHVANPTPPSFAAVGRGVAAMLGVDLDDIVTPYTEWQTSLARSPTSPLAPLAETYFGGPVLPSSLVVDGVINGLPPFADADAEELVASQITWLQAYSP
ncbi:uncharacterized protein AMSG_12453 [Thecamonas trahens ATCC 50062]|uniref:Carrier domain-containing protein n=1 Tax=Thecamonas trahens ATCC 50062 TaxID=461836 RepID=A0A0L0DVK3_THETB|nr:hypothetical protein AMSG_12453 [Thecamonas trahens ATCC 50062]KNC56202.1 hypothetical protein AMSG_12453 [Thecamonas trahens ATCC 50062]|eukprot:XP_013752679.1 hypothetical protein AMSG_12453 [Thecamonas trahens ATCC 50062]